VTLLRHGVDTRRLTVFRALTPDVAISAAGNARGAWIGQSGNISGGAVHFCCDFVIDSALRIREVHDVTSELGLNDICAPHLAASIAALHTPTGRASGWPEE